MVTDGPRCEGSPRFLAWLAHHNRAQADLSASNALMRWERLGNARHGVDCGCPGDAQARDKGPETDPGPEPRLGGDFFDLFRRPFNRTGSGE